VLHKDTERGRKREDEEEWGEQMGVTGTNRTEVKERER
jgi:hypothetical protein